MKMVADQSVMIPIDKIIPYEKNPRRNSKTVELLVKSLPETGFNQPLVIDQNNVIVKGHARYYAAIKLGMTELPCIISDADPEAIKADRIADNKVHEFSKWINEELNHEMDSLNIDMNLEEFGLKTIQVTDEDFGFSADIPESYDVQESEEEKRKRYEEFLARQQAEENAIPVEITTQHDIDMAKSQEKHEASPPPQYFEVACEKCGHIMYIKKGELVECRC